MGLPVAAGPGCFPHGAVNIYNVPVYNFPGWMLIMLYASAYYLIGQMVVQTFRV